jgi:hypothetical protein
MRRRELLLLVGGTVTAAPALHAQQNAMPVVGFLASVSPGPYALYVDAFRQGLRQTGWVEGQNVAIEYRWAEGHYDQLPELAADLVGRKVSVIVTQGGNLFGTGGKERDFIDPDRLSRWRSAGRTRPGRQSGSAGRQPHGHKPSHH